MLRSWSRSFRPGLTGRAGSGDRPEHACEKYSGRWGARLRHVDSMRRQSGSLCARMFGTPRQHYDALSAKGFDRREARSLMRERVDRLLEK